MAIQFLINNGTLSFLWNMLIAAVALRKRFTANGKCSRR